MQLATGRPVTKAEAESRQDGALLAAGRRLLRRLSDAAHLVEGIVLVPWVHERPGRIHELGL